jgi:hypothetical protein
MDHVESLYCGIAAAYAGGGIRRWITGRNDIEGAVGRGAGHIGWHLDLGRRRFGTARRIQH